MLLLVGGCNSRPLAAPVTSRPIVAAANPPALRSDIPTSTDPRQTVPYLASDQLAGRLPGSTGIQKAGDFLALELSRIGASPLPGRSDYFQPFDMSEASTVGFSTHLLINGQSETIGKDFAPMAMSATGDYRGQVAFAGFGITTGADDRDHYDDYTNLDVRGKVVLAMMKEPIDQRGMSRLAGVGARWSNNALFVSKAKNAADHGAIALLLVAPPASGGGDFVNAYNGDGRHSSAIPVLQISRRMANVILSIGGVANLNTLQDQIDASFKPRSANLRDLEIAGSVVIQHTKIPVRNVIAYLPGTGPHANEWVVVGAHYDHLGLGQLGHMAGGRDGSIWHGADDNASGTSAVLELAGQLKKAGPLPRSVLFIFFTAEEEGLIGSDYFVKNPLIPLDNVVGMLNLDMVGRLRGNSLQIGGSGTAPVWDSIVQSAIRGTGLTTTVALPDDGGRGGLGPSDHMSFAEHHIPVLFLFTGMHADYHRPTDTADKINYDGIDELVGVSHRIVDQMATMPKQQYDASNDNNSMTRMIAGNAGHRAVLGVVPDETAMDVTNGVPISGVAAGGPADKAGFKAGDRLIAFNGKPVKTLGDLSEALDEAHGGDKVVVKVFRDTRPIELNAVLEERP